MSLAEIRGQEEAVRCLREALGSGKLVHALLFAGPEGVGKRKTALAVAKALLCARGKGRQEGCGECGECRRVERGTHGDLWEVSVAEGKSGVSIAQVRELSRRLSESPMEGERKVAIIDGAEGMTEEAQNALLKTLEEPSGDTTIILVASEAESLLATVKSRCRRVNFKPAGEGILAEFLEGLGADGEEAREVARVSGGSFAEARELYEGGVGEARRGFLREALSAAEGEYEGIVERIEKAAGGGRTTARDRREAASRLLRAFHSAVSDAVRVKAGAGVLRNGDFEGEIRRFAGERGMEELVQLEKSVWDVIIVLGMNADARLVGLEAASAISEGARGAGKDG